MDGKRRLPLLTSSPDGASGADPQRPRWQWVGFGALAIFVAWVPLAALAAAIAARYDAKNGAGVRVPGGPAWLVGPTGAAPSDAAPAIEAAARTTLVFAATSAGAIAVASLLGGYVMGRWSASDFAAQDAALSGLVAALVAVAGSWAALGVSAGSLAVAAIAVPFAAAGGRLGRLRLRNTQQKR